jgi:hypothetical protein
MKNKLIIILLGLIIIVLVMIVLLFLNWAKQDSPMSGIRHEAILDFKNKNHKVYLRARVWGISGSNEEIVLSEKVIGKTDTTSDYVFYTSEIYYKIDVSENLVIYAPKSSIIEPMKKFKNVNVIINYFENYNEAQNYRKNYKKFGLEKISVYDGLE